MNKRNNTIENTTTGYNTLAHELVAREEQNAGVFFAAFVIQYYLNRSFLKDDHEINLNFLNYYGDVEIYGSQRVVIKEIITNKNYKDIIDFINSFLALEDKRNKEILPHNIFLKMDSKSFLIRQIFRQTDQILPKYEFIDHFANQDILSLDLDGLKKQMKNLNLHEQVLILVRIFAQMHDDVEEKKKPIKESFKENAKRIAEDLKKNGKTETTEFRNLKKILIELR